MLPGRSGRYKNSNFVGFNILHSQPFADCQALGRFPSGAIISSEAGTSVRVLYGV